MNSTSRTSWSPPRARQTKSRSPSAPRVRRPCTNAHRRTKTSPSLPSPTPIPAPPSKAAHSAGARPASCRRSWPTSSRRCKAGEVTQPIRTPSGLHIFKVLEIRGGQAPALVSQVHARHILMKPTEVMDDETVRQKLTQIRDRVLKGESFEAVASVTSEDPGSAATGGDLGWAGPGSFVARLRAAARCARRKRNQPAVPDTVRLAHRAAARATHLRRQRGQHAQSLRQPAARSARRRRNRNLAAAAARRSVRRIPDVSTAGRPRRAMALRTVAVTTGEPAGIGPDLCTELLDTAPPGCRVVLIGDRSLFGRARPRVRPQARPAGL